MPFPVNVFVSSINPLPFFIFSLENLFQTHWISFHENAILLYIIILTWWIKYINKTFIYNTFHVQWISSINLIIEVFLNKLVTLALVMSIAIIFLLFVAEFYRSMWNGRCHHNQGSPMHHNSIAKNHHQSDMMSVRSISSDDISGAIEGHCCSAEARNPAIKRGRQFQLLQVFF